MNADRRPQLDGAEPTVRLVGGPYLRGGSRSCSGMTQVEAEDVPSQTKCEQQEMVASPDPQTINANHPASTHETPQVSWVLAIVLLVVVTVVSNIIFPNV
jgi:hypothetical protein